MSGSSLIFLNIIFLNWCFPQLFSFSSYKKVPTVILVNDETGEEILLKDSRRAISILESFRLATDRGYEKMDLYVNEYFKEYQYEIATDNKGEGWTF